MTDSGSVPYLEGVHWVKGKLIGTGAFCTCSLARDVKNGTMFAVKQVRKNYEHYTLVSSMSHSQTTRYRNDTLIIYEQSINHTSH